MAKNKNRNTVWLVILAVVLLFIWLNASPKSSQIGAQESQLGFDGGFGGGDAGDSGGGGGGEAPGGGGAFNPGSHLDRFFCGKGGGGGGNCEIHDKNGHLHFFRHTC